MLLLGDYKKNQVHYSIELGAEAVTERRCAQHKGRVGQDHQADQAGAGGHVREAIVVGFNSKSDQGAVEEKTGCSWSR